MTDTEQICNAAGQDFTILTSYQQLYRVMVDITWSNPTNSTYWRHALDNEFCSLYSEANGGECFKQINGERICRS